MDMPRLPSWRSAVALDIGKGMRLRIGSREVTPCSDFAIGPRTARSSRTGSGCRSRPGR
jgi:hypothetical protein